MARPELLSALSDPDPARRAAAATVLGAAAARAGARRDPETLRALLDALDDPDATVCRRAAAALGDLGDPEAGRPLMRLVEGQDDATAIVAIRSLQRIGATWAVPRLEQIGGRDHGPAGHAAREAAAELARPPRSRPIDPATQPVPRLPGTPAPAAGGGSDPGSGRGLTAPESRP
jgi:HEAT repeat protein